MINRGQRGGCTCTVPPADEPCGQSTGCTPPRDGVADRLASRFLAVQVAVLLLFSPYLANLSTKAELHGRHWRTGDAVFLLATMAGLGLLCFVAGELVRRSRRRFLLRLFDHCFVVALGAGLLANIAFYVPGISKHNMPMETAWLVLIGLVGYSLATPASKLVHRARQLCWVFSPMLFIVPIHVLFWDTYPSESDPLPQAAPEWGLGVSERGSDDAIQVYVFVFDMWSYERTFDHEEVRAHLPNLAALSQRSIVFHEAHSPGPATMQSIPQLLFDTDLNTTYGHGRVGFKRDGSFVPPSELESLFSHARARGYRTCFVGFTLPYKLWLGDQVETCRSYRWCQQYPGDGVLEQAGMHLARAMRYWTDPWARTLHARYHLALDGLWAIKTHESITRDVLHCICEQPQNTLALFHHPLPHYPYILNEEGGYRKALEVGWDYEDLQAYEQALVGLDTTVGAFLSAMKEVGRLDDALLVLTSDHGWKWDPGRKTGRIRSPLTHVPLMVKLPGQRRPTSVRSPFDTRALHVLIDRVIEDVTDTCDIDDLLKGMLKDEG